jgi:hypothetical protein
MENLIEASLPRNLLKGHSGLEAYKVIHSGVITCIHTGSKKDSVQ